MVAMPWRVALYCTAMNPAVAAGPGGGLIELRSGEPGAEPGAGPLCSQLGVQPSQYTVVSAIFPNILHYSTLLQITDNQPRSLYINCSFNFQLTALPERIPTLGG